MGAQWKHAGRVAAGNAKGKVFSKLAKEIIIAAKNGADLASNARLRMAVEAAKKVSMTRDTIERSIKRGAGLLRGARQEIELGGRFGTSGWAGALRHGG